MGGWMSKENDRLLGQLEAKLQELHTDIREMRVDVTELRADFIRRQTVYKIALWFIGALTGFVGWIANHILSR